MALLNKYLIGSMMYGALYKGTLLWNAKIETGYLEKKRVRPMLLGEKCVAFTIGVSMSPVLAPFWFSKQLDYMDMVFKGKTPEELGYEVRRRGMLDWVFL